LQPDRAADQVAQSGTLAAPERFGDELRGGAPRPRSNTPK
jgi:hypothetical protein